MTFGEKLLKLRKQNGLSQEELASQLTVSRQAISRWEMGSSMPDVENVTQLSKLFGVSYEYLLNDEYENENQEKDILQTNGDDIRMNRASKRTWGTQKTVGTALVAAGIICGLLSFVLNRDIFPILGVYLLICGVSCLTIKKHIVLVLSWIAILPLYYFSRRIDYAMWVLLLILVVLLALTIRCFVKEKSSRNP